MFSFSSATINLLSFTFLRWDPKKRMNPEEAVHHEWLQPSSSSSTFIITSSTSASSLMKHCREQLKENESNQQQTMQKYQRSQPITPLTILPQIKTPSNRVSQRYSGSNTTNNITKDNSRIKGEMAIIDRQWSWFKKNSFSVLAPSTTELDEAQQQQKLYQMHQQQNTRKLSTTINNTNNNNNNTMQHSTISNTSSSSSSSLTGGSGKYGMSHSQSTGDVSAIFGRAWHTTVSNNLTLSVSKSNSSLKNKEKQQQQKVLRMDNLI